MKPYITPEVSATGKKVLRLQCEGVDRHSLWESIKDHNVIAHALPEGQTPRAAWLFQVIFDDARFLEFSSACTQIVDWQEVGSLNVQLAIPGPEATPNRVAALMTIAVPPFRPSSLELLVYEDEDVITECGLVICGPGGREFVVSAGIPPGSVSVASLFLAGSFEPQFSVSACTRMRM